MSMPAPEKYISEFERMGFGLFVHWGLYSVLGMGEWTLKLHNRDLNEYIKIKDSFTAEAFDAEKLVFTAKNAGCKYINLTTRHHDGFSLYDTCGLNDFDAPHSAAKRDLVKEFVDACHKYDIAPFFYHTTIDWYNQDYKNNFESYLKYLRSSVEILCTNYGKIGGVWFDGNWDKPNADWQEDKLYATIRKHQPEAIIVNNTGLDQRGKVGNSEIDSVTFEQGTPTPMNREGMSKYLAAEMCYTLNNHWGVGINDINYKSPNDIIEKLCFCRKVGANLLLNIGPTADGRLNPYEVELLKIVGKWVNIYGESIYNAKPYPAHSNNKNSVLKTDDELYIFCFDLARLGSKNVTLSGNYCGWICFGNINEEIESIKWIDNEEELKFAQCDDLLSVYASGFPYGTSLCVRVAKATIKKQV